MIVVGNRPTQDHFSKVSIYNFLGLKKYQKRVYKNDKKNYIETFEKCPWSVYFPLLAHCLFYILILYRKCFSFQFLYCGIRMHFSTLIGVQNGRISSWKNIIFFWKMFFLKLNFQDEDQFYSQCFFHILSLYRKCFLFSSWLTACVCIFTS